MTIGYLHRDTFALNRGDSVQSWQLSMHLSQKHRLIGTQYSGFNWVEPIYKSKWDTHAFFSQIDVLFVIVDGYVDWYHEKFTFLAKLYRVPVVWLLNSPIEEQIEFQPTRLSYFLQRVTRSAAAKLVDHAICVSTIMEKYAQERLGIKHTTAIPNGADTALFQPSVKPVPLLAQTKQFKVMWSGNGEFTWQALNLIAKVARAFEQKDPSVVFLIQSQQLWTKAELPSNVVLLNAVPYKSLPSYLAAADVCLCLYHDQSVGFYRSPMKLFDYMAMGKPVIASKLGQITEIIQSGKNGFLVANTVAAVSEQIRFLQQHPAEAKRMGKQARADIVGHYTWDAIAQKINTILENLPH